MTSSPGPIQPHHAASPSRVIQGFFPGGRPHIIQASPAPAAPARPQVPAPVQARPASPPAPLLPGRPATGALQPSLRPGQPPRPILPTKVQLSAVQPAAPLRPQAPQPILPQRPTPTAVQPHAGDAFPLPGNFTLKPRGSGQPLPEPIQKKMESFFNTSFADVRVHVGQEASSIGALAFTHGTDLCFAPGQYNPQSSLGQQLLGHELTHVVQQRAGRVRNPLGSGVAVVQDPTLEAEAERMGLRAASASVPIQAKQAVRGPALQPSGATNLQSPTVGTNGAIFPARDPVRTAVQAKTEFILSGRPGVQARNPGSVPVSVILGHELTHVVQQRAGRVIQLKKFVKMPAGVRKDYYDQRAWNWYYEEDHYKMDAAALLKQKLNDGAEGGKLLEYLAYMTNGEKSSDTIRIEQVGSKANLPSVQTYIIANLIADPPTTFLASTTYHNNEQEKYPVSNNKSRYIELGAVAGNARLIVDLEARKVYLSAHYYNPKVLVYNGQAPQSILNLADDIHQNQTDPTHVTPRLTQHWSSIEG